METVVDALEEFILEGDSREVDEWWAEHGVKAFGDECTPENFAHYAEDYSFPHYTADRNLSHEIEDQAEEVHETYCAQMYKIVGSHITGGWNNDWAILRATNRQRILGAAKAMGLEYT